MNPAVEEKSQRTRSPETSLTSSCLHISSDEQRDCEYEQETWQ